MLDERSIESWKYELAIAANTRYNIKNFAKVIEKAIEKNEPLSMDLVLSEVNKLDDMEERIRQQLEGSENE